MILPVASFGPPLSPRTATAFTVPALHGANRQPIGSSTYMDFPSRYVSSTKTPTGALKMVSSVSSAAQVNVTVPSRSISTSTKLSELSESTEPKQTLPSKPNPPIRITGGRGLIPPGELDRLLDQVDIVALIESYGLPGFQRSSPQKATCLCPFHDDKNPSLQINGERGIYKCFSCGAGGNALKFVREYSDPSKSGKPLTFVEAVRVLEDCASTMPMVGGVPRRQWAAGSGGSSSSSTRHGGKKKTSRQQVGLTSRARILHANLFAAAYFEESLFGLSTAGSARTHLRTRGVRPTTVKAFAMGFAPESYFLGGSQYKQPQQQRSWGDGSLVNRLRDEGFTPQEIVDAGLATVTRKGKEEQQKQILQLQQQQQQQKESQNKTSSDDNDGNSEDVTEPQYEHKDFSTLMDRFRGRLMVPIFDATGTHVLGFGGRILETSQNDNSDFKAAKYINSPESLVFRKKELLFGQNMVDFENGANDPASTTVAQRRSRSLIIVEGYMDAIAMWQAGVQETVASMGTALTREQLLAAAEKARGIGGRLIYYLVELRCLLGAMHTIAHFCFVALSFAQSKSTNPFFLMTIMHTMQCATPFISRRTRCFVSR